jgi:hypothetical protein
MEIVSGSAPPKASQAAFSLPPWSTRPCQNGIFCHMGVTTPAGDTQLTRMPSRLSSSAADRASMRMPALLAQYAAACGTALTPDAEPSRTMLPVPRGRMAIAPYLTLRNAASRLTAMTLRQSFRLVSAIERESDRPAHATSASRGPVRSIRLCQLSGLVTSRCTCVSGPAEADTSSEKEMSAAKTSAPSSRSFAATAFPIPDAAPVTSARAPFMRIEFLCP